MAKINIIKTMVTVIASVLLLCSCGGGAGEPVAAAQQTVLAAQIKTGGSSTTSVTAPAAYFDAIERIYVAFLGRPVDAASQAAWADKFSAINAPATLDKLNASYPVDATVKALIDGFSTSDEALSLYAGTDKEYIAAIYQSLFGRAPDSTTSSKWVGQLADHTVSRPMAAMLIMSGAKGRDLNIVNNKVTIANAFLASLNTAQRQAAYSSGTAFATARSLLAGVTASTLTTAYQVQIDAAILSMTAMAAAVTNSNIVTDIRLQSTASISQTNVPFTFGQVFVQGGLLATDGLTGKLANGTLVPLQMDVKATHADGSIRHAIISAVLPAISPTAILTMQLIKTALPAATTSVLPSATSLAGAGLTSSVNLTLGGVAYTASLSEALAGATSIKWLQGNIANEWIVATPLKTVSGGVAHPHLMARFAVRSYSALNKARVDVTIENNWAFEANPQNVTYDVSILLAGQSVYTKRALVHYHQARWRQVFWWGQAQPLHIRHNTNYLIASKAVPNYDPTLVANPQAITALKSAFSGATSEPMGNGLAVPYMPSTGGRSDIGLLPGWATLYLLSMDIDSKRATLGTADLAGSWSIHYRDKLTDRPVSLLNYPYMTILGRSSDAINPTTHLSEAFPVCGGDCTSPNVADSPHQPGFAYLPYLVSGDYYYLEELQFWAMWNVFEDNPYYRGFAAGLVTPDQVRGQAWSLRTLAEAAYITPDSDALKGTMGTFLQNNLNWYNQNYTNNADANVFGVVLNGYSLVYNNGTGLAPWMDDFFTSAIGHAAELGFTSAKPLLAWKSKFAVGRMTAPGFCWIQATMYTMQVQDTSAGPLYASFGRAYQASVSPAMLAAPCASVEMANLLLLEDPNTPMVAGAMVGYPDSSAGYPANLQPALAYATDSKITGSALAWQTFNNRKLKPDYSSSPQFAIVPRAN
ncbi:MAG: DUF4214 domain-containing protein [Pseudomonadota bacterium]